ncbi:MAG: 4Fe-4S cluster-binding domain-containing protein [Candidatus Omnitrophota bacterium]|nr:MAG: 4Fe-4S cluster-binding domain-containing protein [Candidatus Omnitrophota bacterium]
MKPFCATLAIETIRERSRQAWDMLESCRLCPRACGINRLKNEQGVCGIGATALVSSAFPHHGEENCLRGVHGSGAIFFSGCNLNCIYCQNYTLSHLHEGDEATDELIAVFMLQLQKMGCHNVNFVTPTHVVPQILDAVAIAVENGFQLPLVYNTGGYDSVEVLRLLEGIIDIYMPDFKYGDSTVAERFSQAGDYPEIARNAVKEMHRQVGDLVLDDHGIARRGLLIRHLVLPNNQAGTQEIMRFLAEKISPNTFVNIMGQYRPCWKANAVEEINRPARVSEIQQAREVALQSGLNRFDL